MSYRVNSKEMLLNHSGANLKAWGNFLELLMGQMPLICPEILLVTQLKRKGWVEQGHVAAASFFPKGKAEVGILLTQRDPARSMVKRTQLGSATLLGKMKEVAGSYIS